MPSLEKTQPCHSAREEWPFPHGTQTSIRSTSAADAGVSCILTPFVLVATRIFCQNIAFARETRRRSRFVCQFRRCLPDGKHCVFWIVWMLLLLHSFIFLLSFFLSSSSASSSFFFFFYFILFYFIIFSSALWCWRYNKSCCWFGITYTFSQAEPFKKATRWQR